MLWLEHVHKVAPAAILAGAVLTLAVPCAALAGPTPSCSWTSTSYMQRQFGFTHLRAGKPGQVSSGELDCGWSEPRVKYTSRGEVAIIVQYETFADYTIPPGSKPVKNLGSCQGPCQSMGGQTAPSWLTINKGTGSANIHGRPYITGVGLDVQDGSNFIAILVRDDSRPLPDQRGLAAHIEQVARKLVPLFHGA